MKHPQHFPTVHATPARVLTLISTPANFRAHDLAYLLEITPEVARAALDSLPNKITVDPRRAQYIEGYLRKSDCFFYFDVPTAIRQSYYNATDYYCYEGHPLWSDLAFDAT